MGVQFPDLQVLVPRSVDVGPVESTSLQQQTHGQQGLAHEHINRGEQRLQQVQTKAEDSLRAHADNGRAGNGAGTNDRQRRKGPATKGRPPAGPTGHYIDVLA